jgi:hypothetical protein
MQNRAHTRCCPCQSASNLLGSKQVRMRAQWWTGLKRVGASWCRTASSSLEHVSCAEVQLQNAWEGVRSCNMPHEQVMPAALPPAQQRRKARRTTPRHFHWWCRCMHNCVEKCEKHHGKGWCKRHPGKWRAGNRELIGNCFRTELSNSACCFLLPCGARFVTVPDGLSFSAALPRMYCPFTTPKPATTLPQIQNRNNSASN